MRQHLKDYEQPTVVIVRYSDSIKPFPPQNPAVLLQVAVKPDNRSPSGKLIRFGNTPGDEIVGWTPIDYLEVVEVLGYLDQDGKTVTPIPKRADVLDFKGA